MPERTAEPLAVTTARFSTPLKVLAWLSFLAEVVIIGTGGAVRLTGSGLGCTEWPLCTPESLVPLPEQGIHGIIEFGNRTMTGLVGILALAVLFLTLSAVTGRGAVLRAVWFALGGIVLGFAAYLTTAASGLGAFAFSAVLLLAVLVAAIDSIRRIAQRKDLAVLAWLVLAGVMAQAVVGGLAVVTDLNAFIVGFHYTSSLVLVCVTAAYLVRLAAVPGPRERVVPRWFAILTHVTGVALAATILFGVLTTGNGPHSGDENVVRNGFDATVLAHVHSWPGYILAVLVLTLTVTALIRRYPLQRWLLALTGVILVQIAVGVWQAREGLPEILVGTHMVLASLSAAAYTVVVLNLKRTPVPPVATAHSASTISA
ncbi:COX15/CtaA family protein [Microbacterium sp. NPDC055903]